jgi:mannosyltransferase OCH1-like enzyme
MKRTFPKIISIVWLQGIENIPKNIFKQNLKNWKLLNPDWSINLLDDNDLRQACKLYSTDCLKVYDSFDLIHLKIDFARYVLLYNTCTMYIDMDCYALRSLDDSPEFNQLIDKYINKDSDNIIGLSTVNINSFESYMFIGQNKTINNAIMISSPQNPVIKNLIDNIIKTNINNQSNPRTSNYSDIQNTTGPVFINKFFYNFIKNPNLNCHIELFPHYIFEPAQPFGLCDITDSTIAIHKFEMSWISNNLKNLMKFYFKIKPLLIVIPIIIIIYLVNFSKQKSGLNNR